MAGVKIENLNSVNDIKINDSFLMSRDGEAKQILGSTLYNNFSGVKNAISYGGGTSVYKGSINSTNGAIGTTLQFNTLSASDGISLGVTGSLINFSLQDNQITSTKYKDSSIIGTKIASNTILNQNLADGAVTPAKQSNTLASVQTKTAVQQVNANSSSVITGLSALVTPTSVNAKVLLTGTISIGAANAGLLLRRTINNSTTNLFIGADSGNAITETTFAVSRNAGDYNPAPVVINYIDVPNTILPTTYTILLQNTDTKNVAYVNRGLNESNAATCFRAISQFNAIVLP